MKFFSITAIDEAGLVHANANLINERIALTVVEDILKVMGYQDPRISVQITCTAISK